MSNLTTDVVGVWTNTRATVEAGRAEGRGRREWLTAVGVYILLTAALFVFSKLIGSDKLFDHFLGEDTSWDDWKSFFYLTGGIIVCLALISLLQWLVLPRVAGWFGGSRSRTDASLTYYFFVCAGILISLPFMLVDLLAVGLQKTVPPIGVYFYIGCIGIVLLAAAYLNGRIIETSQSVSGLGRAIGVWLVSLLIAIFAFALLALLAMFFIAIFYPDLLETSP